MLKSKLEYEHNTKYICVISNNNYSNKLDLSIFEIKES